MVTVREVADRYGVSTSFTLQALAKIGCYPTRFEQPLSAATVARFDKEWGAKIRAARPAGPAVRGDAPGLGAIHSRSPRLGGPHVMRIAHPRVGATRDTAGNKVKQVLENPGVVHAIDAAGTRDGDPWRGEMAPGEVHFFDGVTNSGPPAACGHVHMRAVLGDEFVPADDPLLAGQCSRCAAMVADGKGYRRPPDPYGRSHFCEAYLRVRVDERVAVKDCCLRDFHDGVHRARDGAEWDLGVDDYVPAPDEVGHRISRAS